MSIKKMDGPLVSIIVITYNSGEYVLETLESAKAQTYRNIELIITDDCSTDNTLNIVGEWVSENRSEFVNVRVLASSFNSGIPSNCNRGLSGSTGEWVKIIAGDDLLLNDCIESNLSFVSERNCHFVFSSLDEFNDSGGDSYFSRSLTNRQNQFIKSKNQLKYFLRDPVFINSPSFFIRKNLFMLTGYYDERFKYIEDQPFIYKVLLSSIPVEFLNKVTVRYRIHKSNLSNGFNPILLEDFARVFEIYRNPLLSNCNLLDLIYKFDYIIFLSKEYFYRNKPWMRVLFRAFNFINVLYYKRFINRLLGYESQS
jgi:glycosyltransferase involved in cell wall biosynthesis